MHIGLWPLRQRSRILGSLLGAAVACSLIGSCQDGSGPSLVTAPDSKPAEGTAPPQPPADPAVAFVSSSPRTGWELKVMNADGSNVSTIHRHSPAYQIMSPSWSPDGRSIAFAIPNTQAIWLIDVTLVNGVPTGTNARVLVTGTPGVNHPAWSPLGNEIAFSHYFQSGTYSTIEVVPPTGGTPVVLYTSPPGMGLLSLSAWSPDASRIAFGFDESIQVLNIATGTVTPLLTPPPYPSGHLDWGRTRGLLALQMETDPTQGVYTFDIATGVLTRVADGRMPTWSPDDTQILFSAPTGKLTKVELATGNITNLRIAGVMPEWRRF